jgi:hypothetical protein
MEITRVQQYYEFFAALRESAPPVVVGVGAGTSFTPGFSEPKGSQLLSL